MKRSAEYQGLWSFPDFHTYREQWILPNLVEDLDTVFEGARERWEKKGSPKDGRGDFILATALFALFDHLGAFLAEDENTDSFEAGENIARTSRNLLSTKDAYSIVANYGRNALVHGAWPRTAAVMRSTRGTFKYDSTWAFGLNVTANPDDEDHNLLYTRLYPLPSDPKGREVRILKLRLNIRVLWRELETFINCEQNFHNINPEVFKKVQNFSINDYDPKSSFQNQREGNRKLSLYKVMKNQIEGLRIEAEQIGSWPKLGVMNHRRTKPH